MRRPLLRAALAAACAAILAPACDGPAMPARTEFVTATITGAIKHEYLGSGLYFPGSQDFAWSLTSYGRDDSETQYMAFFFLGSGVPAIGSHSVGPFAGAAPAPDFAFEYRVPGVQQLDFYESVDGTFVLSAAGSQRIEGSFSVTARHHSRCEAGPAGAPICTPIDPEDAPVIEVTGSFNARLFN
jgi:hypothetical protein